MIFHNISKIVRIIAIFLFGLIIYFITSKNIGETLVCTALISLIDFLADWLNLSKTLQIFSIKGKDKNSKFKIEDKKCKKLKHVSYSAGKLLSQLASPNQTDLKNAFSKNKAQIRILIVSPFNGQAIRRAKEERRDAPHLSIDKMIKSFKLIENIYTLYTSIYDPYKFGRLWIRVTNDNPLVSANIYDDKLAIVSIFLHSFFDEETPFFIVKKRNQSNYFNQIDKHFDKLWALTERNIDTDDCCTLLELSNQRKYFDKSKFDQILHEFGRILKQL